MSFFKIIWVTHTIFQHRDECWNAIKCSVKLHANLSHFSTDGGILFVRFKPHRRKWCPQILFCVSSHTGTRTYHDTPYRFLPLQCISEPFIDWWWRHNMETISALLACEGIHLSQVYSLNKVMRTHCDFFRLVWNVVEQTVGLSVVWDAMTFMWRHCNVSPRWWVENTDIIHAVTDMSRQRLVVDSMP